MQQNPFHLVATFSRFSGCDTPVSEVLECLIQQTKTVLSRVPTDGIKDDVMLKFFPLDNIAQFHFHPPGNSYLIFEVRMSCTCCTESSTLLVGQCMKTFWSIIIKRLPPTCIHPFWYRLLFSTILHQTQQLSQTICSQLSQKENCRILMTSQVIRVLYCILSWINFSTEPNWNRFQLNLTYSWPYPGHYYWPELLLLNEFYTEWRSFEFRFKSDPITLNFNLLERFKPNRHCTSCTCTWIYVLHWRKSMTFPWEPFTILTRFVHHWTMMPKRPFYLSFQSYFVRHCGSSLTTIARTHT